MAGLDERLIRAWQGGDREAREQVWEHLSCTLYSVAVRFCRGFSADDPTARQHATSAFGQTWIDIEKAIRRGKVGWRDEQSFVGLVLKHLIRRCRDECRSYWRTERRKAVLESTTAGEEEAISLLDTLGFASASQEDELHVAERDIEGIRRILRRLACAREICQRQNWAAEVEVLAQIETYVWRLVAETAPPGLRVDTISLDELLNAATLEELAVSKAEMYRAIQDELGINPNTVYLRMKHIREVLTEPPEPDDDRNGLLGTLKGRGRSLERAGRTR
jgi:hypothetical protein